MNTKHRYTPLAIITAVALTTIQCSNSSPTQPSTTAAMSGVTLSAANIAAGSTLQGLVSLSGAAAAGGASIVLVSSNTGVATVQTPITVLAGASSAAFTVTAMAAGSAVFTATFNGTSQSPTLTVTGAAALSSIAFSSRVVIGGNPVVGTVTLSSAASGAGAVVSLSSSDPVTVPTSVTVPAGLRTATFTASTREVAGTIPATVTAAYGGATASATLSLIPFVATVATASFGVTGTSITDTCGLINGGNTLECTFDGSTSTAPGTIVKWNWTYSVGLNTRTQTTTGPVLDLPSAGCSLLPAPPLPAGATSFPLTVRLTIEDSRGNVSPQAVDEGARVLPQGACGF